MQVEIAFVDLTLELGSVTRMERRLSIHHLEQDDANGPDVSLVAILSLLDNLRCHIQRSTANGTVSLVQLIESLGEAEISNLDAEVCLH